MANRLVTLATFDTIAQAHVAKGELEAIGVRAFLTDEETVGMLWHFANALGGVKIQIAEEDSERAVALLRERFGTESEEPLDGPSLEEQALAMPREDEDDPEPAVAPPEVFAPAVEEPPTPREENARKLLLVAWLGIIIPPLSFFALYVLLKSMFGAGPLSRQGRINVVAGALWMIPCLLLMSIAVLGLLGYVVYSLLG